MTAHEHFIIATGKFISAINRKLAYLRDLLILSILCVIKHTKYLRLRHNWFMWLYEIIALFQRAYMLLVDKQYRYLILNLSKLVLPIVEY